MNIPKLIGPQLYSTPKAGKKCVSINVDLDFIRTNRVLNFTGYAYVDMKMRIGLNLLQSNYGLLVIHDTDYLGLAEYAEMLKSRNHTVCFVLAPREWSVKRMGDRANTVFGGAPASNNRIRKAYDRLKSLGVSVKKFQNPLALERYLLKKTKAA